MMSIDNRVAERKPDSHPISFRCIESLKEFCGGFRRETYSHIFHGEAHLVSFIPFRFDKQLSRAIFDETHCVRRIA